MNREKTFFFTLVLLMVFLFSPSASARFPLAERKDAVVITGEQLKPFLGTPINSLSLLVWQGGKFIPIPFQMDEKTQEGEYVFPNGKQKNPEQGNGLLDAQDELVFMARDAGEPAPEPAPVPESAQKGVKLVITDPLTKNQAFAYLLVFSSNPPRSTKDYVCHLVEEERNFVKTDYYWFGEPIGKGFFDRLHLISPSGKLTPNIADRIKGRGRIRSLGGLVKINAGEYNTPTDMVAWIDGPVRVIRRMLGGVELLGLKIRLSGGANNVFYQDWFYTPIFFSVPRGVSSLLKGSYMLYTIDFNKNFLGSYYFDPVNPDPVVLDGKMTGQEKNLDRETHHNWYAVGGDIGNLVERFIVPDEWTNFVKITTFYVDDSTEEDPPEAEPGRHQPGFKISGMFEVPPGKYEYRLYYMVSDQKLNQSTVQPWLNILDHPLKISVQKLEQKISQ